MILFTVLERKQAQNGEGAAKVSWEPSSDLWGGVGRTEETDQLANPGCDWVVSEKTAHVWGIELTAIVKFLGRFTVQAPRPVILSQRVAN